MRLGALEAGGTKMVCAVGDETGTLFDRISIPTETPGITIPKLISYFREQKAEALGIGCFGPLDLDSASPTYGYITSTPKLAWADYNIVGALKTALGIPIGFDTDVNAAVLGEVTWGAAAGCQTAIYITIGTGVGVGVYANGGLLHGLVHPEGGHVLLKRLEGDTYQGHCPYHRDCIEGLAAGPAIEERWGEKAASLAGRKEVWEMEADYIAQAVCTYALVLSPNKIILWGGVMHQEQLFPLVREKVRVKLNGYIHHPAVLDDIGNYIVAPGLGDDPGIKGSLKLAEIAWKGQAS